jgi:hypothetical protein
MSDSESRARLYRALPEQFAWEPFADADLADVDPKSLAVMLSGPSDPAAWPTFRQWEQMQIDLAAAREEVAGLTAQREQLITQRDQYHGDLAAARDLLRQATRGGRDMPGHAEVVGGMCACKTCAELRRLTGLGRGKWNG